MPLSAVLVGSSLAITRLAAAEDMRIDHFESGCLDAAGNLLETASGLVTQNWKFGERRQLLTSALRQPGVEYSMFDVGLSGSFPTCLASIEAGHMLTLEFPRAARREFLSTPPPAKPF